MDAAASHKTCLFEFRVEPSTPSLIHDDAVVVTPLVDLMKQHLAPTEELLRRAGQDWLTLILELRFAGDSPAGLSVATVRLRSCGLVLVDVDLTAGSHFDNEACRAFENNVRDRIGAVHSKSICPIRRGGPMDAYRYLASSDDRILEYDVDHVVADVRSKYQRVQILNTLNFGNLLLLDELQNLADSDLVYTETLMQRGSIDYTDKDVLVLGAGDGALLWELLKEKPRMVTMIEIDETVIQLCRQHLRKACGTALDSYKGPHHQIIIGDCLVELDRMVERGDGFDYVFSDLTDIPLSSSETQSAEWQFLSNVLTKSLRLLRRGGRFLTHGSGVSSVRSLDNFEAHLKNLSDPVRVEYRRYNAFVPSFMEDWVFYQIWPAGADEDNRSMQQALHDAK